MISLPPLLSAYWGNFPGGGNRRELLGNPVKNQRASAEQECDI